jgi:hypothetical protein
LYLSFAELAEEIEAISKMAKPFHYSAEAVFGMQTLDEARWKVGADGIRQKTVSHCNSSLSR